MTGHTDTDLTARLAAALNEEGCLGDQRAAEARGKLAEEIATLMAGRMHLGPTSMGRLSAILDVARDPGLLEEAGRET
jgi:hypothetical protein